MDTSDRVDRLISILDACLLPELRRDLGSDPIDSNLFEDYRQILNVHLIQLFDLIQQSEDLLYDTEGYTRQFRCKFLLVLCEQSAPEAMFQTNDLHLFNNLKKLIETHFSKMLANDSKLLVQIFDHYKERLRKDIWKRQLGPVHGFDRFIELYYCTYGNHLSEDLCTFCLSVSLLLEEFYEPVYKEISFRLFYAILTQTPRDVLHQINLHSVIYETLVNNILKVNTVCGTETLWNGLILCLTLMNISDYTKWNKCDDLIEALIRRISLESNSDICIRLFTNFSKICLINSDNSLSLMRNLDRMVYNGTCTADLKSLCDEAKCQNNKIFYKWAKRLLQLFVAESYRMLTSENVAVPMLRSIHICYTLCIMPIPTKVSERHLRDFFGKFIPVLMEMVSVHNKASHICKVVEEFLNTISHHISEESYQKEMSNDMNLYRANINKLLLLSIFQ